MICSTKSKAPLLTVAFFKENKTIMECKNGLGRLSKLLFQGRDLDIPLTTSFGEENFLQSKMRISYFPFNQSKVFSSLTESDKTENRFQGVKV